MERAHKDLKFEIGQYLSTQFERDFEQNELIKHDSVDVSFSQGILMFMDSYRLHEEYLYEGDSNTKGNSMIVNIFRDSLMNTAYKSKHLKIREAGYQLKKKTFIAIYEKKAVELQQIASGSWGGQPGDFEEAYMEEASRDSKVLVQGLIIKSTPKYIEAVFDCSSEAFEKYANSHFVIGKYNSRIPFDRCTKLHKLLDDLSSDSSSLYSRLLCSLANKPPKVVSVGIKPEVLFGPMLKDKTWTAFQALNESQKSAVQGALLCDDYYMIHGPPGTGKSETLIVLLEALVKQNQRVLICSEANNPVDNLLTKFSKTKVYRHHHESDSSSRMVLRLGNSWLVEPACRKYTLTKLVQDKIRHVKSSQRGEAGKIDKQRLDNLILGILEKSQLVFTTQCSLYRKLVFDHFYQPKHLFDYAIVDEASQSFVAFALMAVSCSKKIIFAGDHLQLPPVIMDNKLRQKLEVSLFERLIDRQKICPPQRPVYSMLDTQYRMSEALIKTSSDLFYESKVHSGKNNRHILLSDLKHLQASAGWIPSDKPSLWIDNSGFETVQRRGEFVNHSECSLVLLLLKELLFKMRLKEEEIGVIVSYNSQRELISNAIAEDPSFVRVSLDVDKLMVSTVDSFQGREKEVVIYASTRSNPRQDIGFLSDRRRFNVAVTRAKRLMIFIGNSGTLIHDSSSVFSTLMVNIRLHGKILMFDEHSEQLSEASQKLLDSVHRLDFLDNKYKERRLQLVKDKQKKQQLRKMAEVVGGREIEENMIERVKASLLKKNLLAANGVSTSGLPNAPKAVANHLLSKGTVSQPGVENWQAAASAEAKRQKEIQAAIARSQQTGKNKFELFKLPVSESIQAPSNKQKKEQHKAEMLAKLQEKERKRAEKKARKMQIKLENKARELQIAAAAALRPAELPQTLQPTASQKPKSGKPEVMYTEHGAVAYYPSDSALQLTEKERHEQNAKNWRLHKDEVVRTGGKPLPAEPKHVYQTVHSLPQSSSNLDLLVKPDPPKPKKQPEAKPLAPQPSAQQTPQRKPDVSAMRSSKHTHQPQLSSTTKQVTVSAPTATNWLGNGQLLEAKVSPLPGTIKAKEVAEKWSKPVQTGPESIKPISKESEKQLKATSGAPHSQNMNRESVHQESLQSQTSALKGLLGIQGGQQNASSKRKEAASYSSTRTPSHESPEHFTDLRPMLVDARPGQARPAPRPDYPVHPHARYGGFEPAEYWQPASLGYYDYSHADHHFEPVMFQERDRMQDGPWFGGHPGGHPAPQFQRPPDRPPYPSFHYAGPAFFPSPSPPPPGLESFPSSPRSIAQASRHPRDTWFVRPDLLQPGPNFQPQMGMAPIQPSFRKPAFQGQAAGHPPAQSWPRPVPGPQTHPSASSHPQSSANAPQRGIPHGGGWYSHF